MAAALSMSEALFGRQVGAGAPWPTLRQGDKFAVTIQVAAADSALPLSQLGVPTTMSVGASVGLKGPPDSLGFVTYSFTGTYSGKTPFAIPALFMGVTTHGQYTGRNATVLAATSTPAGHVVIGGIPIHILGGSSGGVGVVLQQLKQGRRYSLTIRAASGGVLPASLGSYSSQLTKEQIQAQVDAAGIQSTVVSVKYAPDSKALVLEEDHCGPTINTSNPYTSGGVTTTFADMGAASCGAVQPAGWSTTKKAVVFGGGALALAVVAAGATKAAGLW